MIPFTVFLRALEKSIKRVPNFGQRRAIEATQGAALFIVAGPGTGKTATMTMRMLKLMFVDGVRSSGILATTFTKKAAAELRSRLLSWGYDLQEYLQEDAKLAIDVRRSVEQIDINQVRTGTIDSICEELLRDFRDFGTDPPVLADDFVSRTLLLREGVFQSGRYKDDDLTTFLCDKRGTGKFGWNVGAKNTMVRTIWDRRYHDQLDWAQFVKAGATKTEKAAIKILDAALADYTKGLGERLMVDFAQLEQTVLMRLKTGGLK